MKPENLTNMETKALVTLAVLGALIPNGVFCYYLLTSPQTTKAALANPIALVFMAEAFILMFLFAWLLRKFSSKRPSSLVFIVMSLLGSMVFSVPATLCLLLRNKNESSPPAR